SREVCTSARPVGLDLLHARWRERTPDPNSVHLRARRGGAVHGSGGRPEKARLGAGRGVAAGGVDLGAPAGPGWFTAGGRERARGPSSVHLRARRSGAVHGSGGRQKCARLAAGEAVAARSVHLAARSGLICYTPGGGSAPRARTLYICGLAAAVRCTGPA